MTATDTPITTPASVLGDGASLATVVGLELRQRVRSVAWYALVGASTAVVGIVTALLTIAFWSPTADAGGGVFTGVLAFVLLLGTLVAPALSGGSINGDRDAGTLATTQVTLVTTTQLVVGKFLASWIASLGFLAASTPFLVFAALLGGVTPQMVLVAVPMIAIELGVVAAVGVGLSALVQRPVFSIALSYLVVMALSVGSLIAFGLTTSIDRVDVAATYRSPNDYNTSPANWVCDDVTTETYTTNRTDRAWVFLAANPYVVVADAIPTTYVRGDDVGDLFGYLKVGVRTLQEAPDTEVVYDECDTSSYPEQPTARETLETYTTNRTDRAWVFLAANPYVVVADAIPTTYVRGDDVGDLFGYLKVGVRTLQEAPDTEVVYDECDTSSYPEQPTARETLESSTPSWFVGLALHLVLAAAALVGAGLQLRTPAKRLATGSRIA